MTQTVTALVVETLPERNTRVELIWEWPYTFVAMPADEIQQILAYIQRDVEHYGGPIASIPDIERYSQFTAANPQELREKMREFSEWYGWDVGIYEKHFR